MPFPSSIDDWEGAVERVVIGVDPAKRSHAIEVIDEHEKTVASGVFPNDNAGYRQMRQATVGFLNRAWAVEGAGGVGRQLAQRLIADGETVVDVPPKLSTRVRAMSTGHGRKTDPTDARAVAIVGLRNSELTQVVVDDETVALRLLRGRGHVHQRRTSARGWPVRVPVLWLPDLARTGRRGHLSGLLLAGRRTGRP